MSKYEFVRKNLELSADFNSYLLANPSIISDIPGNACIVFGTKEDKNFSKRNIDIARKTKKKCFIATKDKGKWNISAFSNL